LKYIFSIVLIPLFAFAEAPQSGIFIVQKPTRKIPCEQELKMLIGTKKICILKNPLLDIDELEYVTDILYDFDLKNNYIEIGLSSASANTLNQTISIMRDVQFALVINRDVICIFTIQERMNTRYLRIGMDLDFKNLVFVHDILKKHIQQ
jgi:hypothetical protein